MFGNGNASYDNEMFPMRMVAGAELPAFAFEETRKISEIKIRKKFGDFYIRKVKKVSFSQENYFYNYFPLLGLLVLSLYVRRINREL